MAMLVPSRAFARGGLLKEPGIAMKNADRGAAVQKILADKKYKFLGGIYINAHTTLCYSGDTAQLNLFLDDLSKVEHVSIHVQFSKTAIGTTLSLGDSVMEIGASQWRVVHNGWLDEDKFQVIVQLDDAKIDLEKLYIPDSAPTAATLQEAAGHDESWSNIDNGLQARLSFAPQKEITNGTPILVAYLELRNVSDVGNVMEIPLDRDKVQFSVTDAAGKEVAVYNGPYDGSIAPFGTLCIPHDGSLRFNIACRGAGIPKDQAALLDLGGRSSWVFPRGEKGAYFLQAKFSVEKSKDRHWFGTIEIPKTKIPVTAAP
jgi:hypothetical protein